MGSSEFSTTWCENNGLFQYIIEEAIKSFPLQQQNTIPIGQQSATTAEQEITSTTLAGRKRKVNESVETDIEKYTSIITSE